MATQADVRRIASALPHVVEAKDRFAFAVRVGAKDKGFAWVWLERLDPKKGRMPCPAVLAVRVHDEDEKLALLALDERKFFTEPHYHGYPAVLVRLKAVRSAELRRLLTNAWRCQAPRALADAFAGAAPTARRPARAPRRRSSPAPGRAARGRSG